MDFRFDQKEYDISLTEDGEGKVDIDLVQSSDEVLMQRLFVRFKTFPRDLFWNLNYGIDYISDVFGMNRPKSSVDALIRLEIAKEPMVDSIVDFKSAIVAYNYSCNFSVKLKGENVITLFHVLTNESGITLTNESGLALTTRI